MKKKWKGIFRYSNVDPVKIEYRYSLCDMVKIESVTARILAWLLLKELESWHKRKKRPLWHFFNVKTSREEINASADATRSALKFLEEQRYVRRRYRYIHGHRGCRLYVRLMLPNELLIWEKDPNYKRKYTMHEPTNGFQYQKMDRETAEKIIKGELKLADLEEAERKRVTHQLRKLGHAPRED